MTLSCSTTHALRDRVVVVAPHPDDEIIGAAGLMQLACQIGCRVDVVAVTDGEASHARSELITRSELRRRRMGERAAALRHCGLDGIVVHRLALPDGNVARHVDYLAATLQTWAAAGAVLIAPCGDDGHPDHEATSAAARLACRAGGGALWEMPIWARTTVGGDGGPIDHVVELGDFGATKRRAIECFGSQIHPLGPGPFDGPVLSTHALAVWCSATTEVFVEVAS
jgi:LmbE family N-acetylglucosaminyl deacetylase